MDFVAGDLGVRQRVRGRKQSLVGDLFTNDTVLLAKSESWKELWVNLTWCVEEHSKEMWARESWSLRGNESRLSDLKNYTEFQMRAQMKLSYLKNYTEFEMRAQMKATAG